MSKAAEAATKIASMICEWREGREWHSFSSLVSLIEHGLNELFPLPPEPSPEGVRATVRKGERGTDSTWGEDSFGVFIGNLKLRQFIDMQSAVGFASEVNIALHLATPSPAQAPAPDSGEYFFNKFVAEKEAERREASPTQPDTCAHNFIEWVDGKGWVCRCGVTVYAGECLSPAAKRILGRDVQPVSAPGLEDEIVTSIVRYFHNCMTIGENTFEFDRKVVREIMTRASTSTCSTTPKKEGQ